MRNNALAVTTGAVLFVSQALFATIINFDDQGLTGPSYFYQATGPQHLVISTADGSVTFDGGVILDNTASLPANQTAVYGTAHFGIGTVNPLTLTFENPIENFYMDVYNGLTTDITYSVTDNTGNTTSFTLAPNLNSGRTLVEFPTLGTNLTIASISLPTSSYDFFIDNIHFNETLPSQNVPEPTFLSLLGLGLTGLAFFRRKNKNII